MLEKYISLLFCPVTRSELQVEIISLETTSFATGEIEIIEGILFAKKDWFYPIVNGVPRLLIESFLDHENFLKANLSDYEQRKEYLLKNY